MAERSMTLSGIVRFLAGRFWLNLKSSYDYRASFWSQILFMMMNNAFMLWFWRLFFGRFGQVGHWGLHDVYLLYAMSAIAFGLSNVFAGNAMNLAGMIADGELDYFIGLPPPTLLHAMITRVQVSAIGDLIFGIVLLFLVLGGDPVRVSLALLVSVPAAIVFTSVIVLVSTLAFFLGESRGITFQLVNALVAFSTYPDSIFRGSMHWVLYLIIPAGFMSHLPVHVIHPLGGDPSGMVSFSKLVFGSVTFGLAAILAFRRGLKRYSTGSSMGIRI